MYDRLGEDIIRIPIKFEGSIMDSRDVVGNVV